MYVIKRKDADNYLRSWASKEDGSVLAYVTTRHPEEALKLTKSEAAVLLLRLDLGWEPLVFVPELDKFNDESEDSGLCMFAALFITAALTVTVLVLLAALLS